MLQRHKHLTCFNQSYSFYPVPDDRKCDLPISLGYAGYLEPLSCFISISTRRLRDGRGPYLTKTTLPRAENSTGL